MIGSMFLLGGPPFCGKTLLAHQLNQGPLVCLDEPDFHNPEQSHRGIPFLRELFPECSFPEGPTHRLSYEQAVDLIHECQGVLSPHRLGIKTAEWASLAYAEIYKKRGYPTIAVVRDIRDVLTEAPLPEWIDGEKGLNDRFRLIWRSLRMFDLLVRYEDLVMNPEHVLRKISELLSCDLKVLRTWEASSVHRTMLKLSRHDLLKTG